MPEIEIFEDKSVLVGKRRKGRDETIEDALKTMERLADWLAIAQDPVQNVWTNSDPLNSALLYGMLLHLREDIDKVIERGGDQALASYQFFASKR